MGKIKKFIKKHPVFIYIAALIPFVVSCYGYYITGKFTFWEFVYAAIAVYFVNPVSEDVNAFILFGEITSVIVTAGIILSVLKYAYAKIEHFFIRLKKDSTVVYTDNELGYALASSLKNGYATENDSRPEKVKNHIVMFEDDAKNITFYSQNETRLKDQKVFMMMTELDSTLLKATDTSEADLHFFNTNELLARDYWKKYNLYNHKDKSFKIAIIILGYNNGIIVGYGALEIPAPFYAYDRECPNCFDPSALPMKSYPLSMTSNGIATCGKCHRQYDMNNNGFITDGEKGKRLTRYRATTTGPFGVLVVN